VILLKTKLLQGIGRAENGELKMMKSFIFDVDGTLTPSRESIDKDFCVWFTNFCTHHNVYLVTGSDHAKTVEQLGQKLCDSIALIYNCSGNDVWCKNKKVRTNTWILPEDVHSWLADQLAASKFPLRTGLHFEHRPGSCNFSIVGRNANRDQRVQYVQWDLQTSERKNLVTQFNRTFHELESHVGGETGFDIFPKGFDKSQILKDFDSSSELHFFGDRMAPEENDYPLAMSIQKKGLGKYYHVKDWKETWNILSTMS